jgi:hypothetical protein
MRRTALLVTTALATGLLGGAPAARACGPDQGPVCWVQCLRDNPPTVNPKDVPGTVASLFPSCPV